MHLDVHSDQLLHSDHVALASGLGAGRVTTSSCDSPACCLRRALISLNDFDTQTPSKQYFWFPHLYMNMLGYYMLVNLSHLMVMVKPGPLQGWSSRVVLGPLAAFAPQSLTHVIVRLVPWSVLVHFRLLGVEGALLTGGPVQTRHVPKPEKSCQ